MEYIKGMRTNVVKLAHEHKVNPDQLVSFAIEYKDDYDTISHIDMEKVTISSQKAKEAIRKFKYDNRKGHDWRDKLVPETIDEAIDFQRGVDPKASMGIGQVDKWRKDLENIPYGGRDAHEYIRSIIEKGPEYENAIMALLVNLSNELRDLIDNVLCWMPEVYLYFAENHPVILNNAIRNNTEEFIKANFSIYNPGIPLNIIEKRDADFIDRIMKTVPIQKLWNEFTDSSNSEMMKRVYKEGANPKIGKIKPYVIAIDNRDLELLKILLKDGEDPAVGFPRTKRKEYNYPIRRAAFNGWVEGFKELLADPRTDPSDHDNSALKEVQNEIKNLLAGDMELVGRNWRMYKDPESPKLLLQNYKEILELLMADQRVRDKIGSMAAPIKSRLRDWGYLKETVSFQRGQDPKKAMGLGIKVLVERALKEAGYKGNELEVLPSSVIIFSKNAAYWQLDKLQEIALKYMPSKFSDLIKKLKGSSVGSPFEKTIKEAIENGIDPEDLKVLLDNYTDKASYGKILLTKYTRSPEKEQEDEENNVYIFIGYTDKVPTFVNGKKYYEDKFTVESMVKIDKYNPDHLSMVTGMKLRVRYQGHEHEDYGVYMITVPKFLMDEDKYYEIPEHVQEIVEKYKRKI